MKYFIAILSLLIIGTNGHEFDYNQLDHEFEIKSSGLTTIIPDRSGNNLGNVSDVLIQITKSFNETQPSNYKSYITSIDVSSKGKSYNGLGLSDIESQVKNEFIGFNTAALIDAITIGSEGEAVGSYLNISTVSNIITLNVLICAANKINETSYDVACISSNSTSGRVPLTTPVYHSCCDCDVGCCGCWICWGHDGCTTYSPRGPTLDEINLMKQYLKSMMFPNLYQLAKNTIG
jgi:hypothetical protein